MSKKVAEEVWRDTVEDLLTWEEESDQLLPISPEYIADLEEQGFIVDLVSGVVSVDPDFVKV
jgi:hypothetical protein